MKVPGSNPGGGLEQIHVLILQQNASIAQWIEQHSSKVKVPGSNPGGGVEHINVQNVPLKKGGHFH